MSKKLNSNEIRELSFQRTRDEYFEENEYGRRYVAEFLPKINPSEIISDHEAKRLNGLQSFVNSARYFIALNMEPYESEETPGFRNLVKKAVKTNNPKLLEGVKFPYEFPDKGLKSTHFDVINPVDKGTAEKIFISLPDPSLFKDGIRKLIAEDEKIFTNQFTETGLNLLNKLELQGELSQSESEDLVKDYMKEFSSRKVPMKASTYEAIKSADMVGLDESKAHHPEILAIGLVFSGHRNHCTLPIEGQNIVNTPDELEKIGVPKGNPPVQFKDGLVQTSSGGVKQTGELIDDSINTKEINKILLSDKSADEKRYKLKELGAIKEREFNHEYVEYATRALLAKVEVDNNGEKEIQILPVWQMADGTYRSAREEDRDLEGIANGKYSNNQFESYVKEVNIIEIVKDSKGHPARFAGFKADNATNIFLGTSEGTK
jgi:hypothetical protein